jgi:hypothetical protein
VARRCIGPTTMDLKSARETIKATGRQKDEESAVVSCVIVQRYDGHYSVARPDATTRVCSLGYCMY